MTKSTNNHHDLANLANITTYQSGVVQASAHRIVQKHTATALSRYRLTSMQWFTIGTILDTGDQGIRLSDLARSLDTTLTYITNTINLLESRKIVIKKSDAKDARIKWVTINPKYRDTCEEIEQFVRSELRALLYSEIKPQELTTYINVLYKINTLDK